MLIDWSVVLLVLFIIGSIGGVAFGWWLFLAIMEYDDVNTHQHHHYYDEFRRMSEERGKKRKEKH